MFRNLTEEERGVIDKKRKRNDLPPVQLDNQQVEYVHQGNFVTALLKNKKYLFVGVAKRMPTDFFMEETGETIALGRAILNQPVEISPK